MCDLSRAVGMGSRAHVQGFILLRTFSMWLCCTSVKYGMGCTLTGRLLAAGGDRGEELVIRVRMLLTLDLKKSIKQLHCSSVASVEEEDCGFSRWSMVEKKCFVLPGFLLMRFE